jgi:hypothetical protein
VCRFAGKILPCVASIVKKRANPNHFLKVIGSMVFNPRDIFLPEETTV